MAPERSPASPHPSVPIARVTLAGVLTLDLLQRELARAEEMVEGGARVLVVDCRSMTDYERAAREYFVDWNRRHRDRIERVAVITANIAYRMIVSTMGLVSKQSMRAFPEPDEAYAWLSEQS